MGQPNIFIRLHPKDAYENYTEFLHTKDLHIEQAGRQMPWGLHGEKRVEMDSPDLENLKYTLMYTDVNINYASSISLEACIFNTPIINIVLPKDLPYYNDEHYKPLVESGAVKVAYNRGELENLINLYLDNPSLHTENRKGILKKFISFTDGLSYKRNVDFLEIIINRENL